LKELESLVAGLGWKVKPFGSLCNGFAMRGSDLDITCCLEGDQEKPPTARQMLELALPLLEAHSKFKIVDTIKAAMVPIVKVNFEQVLDVDISFKNTTPLPNTQLLRAYSELDPRVRDLVLMVKLWARASGVCGAANGHLSAYSFTLMAIYFLQVDARTRMPCLDTSLFRGEGGVPKEAKVAWSCKLGRWDLLFSFFDFFAREFHWGSEVVSVRVGRRSFSVETLLFDMLKGRTEERLHIEDPFQLSRNLHCVLRLEKEYKLYDKLWEAMQSMSRLEVPAGLVPIETCRTTVLSAPWQADSSAEAVEHHGHPVVGPKLVQAGGWNSGPRPEELPMPRLQLMWAF